MDRNPKLANTNLIDCIPQTGECPMGCAECFYNGGRFYRTLDKPLFPTPQEAAGKIVRINSGHDSNIQREYVIESTNQYEHRFFNTSHPRFDFPAPVVFTCNGRESLFVECPKNVMFVRIRTNSWGLGVQDSLVEYYLAQGVPVVMTFMRYYNQANVVMSEDYEWRKSILNDYYCIKTEVLLEILKRYKGRGVRMCSTPWSSVCVDCRNCELLYWECLRRMEE
ncbi:hypothetical protein KKD19_04405 [Patescibacteria group bacterium]|nr:hypothetical protein [Patescibacteria group bacterium]MBU4512450.1 hypothetical protein [Patescibacteria group bacterium]MCG2692578.1 hypothetical protein [Candidatus Parcubacteria bacterium]